MKVTIVKYLNPKGKVVEMRKDNFKGSYMPENIIEEYEVEIKGEDSNEEFRYRLKVKDLAWYEDESMVGKLLKAENPQTGLNELCVFKHKGDSIITAIGLDGKDFIGFFSTFRPATESEVLSLVYKPQPKVSKEINLTESNRLKDLFLDDKAECLVENEQEFKLVYDFLDKNCDEILNRWLEDDGKFEYDFLNDEFPIVISTSRKWGNVFEWNKLKNRNKNKPLIKFNGETFWKVFE